MFESLNELWYRIRARFRRDELDAELADELRAHAEFLEEEARAAGASPDDARRAASERLGNMTTIRERTRERWSFGWVEALLQDTRYAFRFLRRSPGFTSVAVLSLALGIGANATVFTVADKLLFSAPAHVENAGELHKINIRRDAEGQTQRGFHEITWFPEYFALKEHATSFAAIAVYTPPSRVRMGRGPSVPRIKESMVSANYFATLGVTPLRGRFVLPSDEDETNSPHAAVISYGFWQRQFAGADSAVGAHFTSSDLAFVVVGIAPRDFSGTELDAADVWVPLGAVAPNRIGRDWKTWTGNVPRVLVRLRDSVALGVAEAEATVIVRRLPDSDSYPGVSEAVALGSVIAARGPGEQRTEVTVSTRLVVASALVLLAACANLANLLLVRALTRRRELALRLAIGVSRGRLASQMLLESLIIALGGSILALMIASWGGTGLRKLVFPELQWASSTLDVRVFAFSVLCGTLVALVATVAPAIRLTRSDVASALRSAAPQLTASTGRLRQSLLALQVALSVLLIIGAAAFSKSLNEAYAFDMGIDVDRLITARFSFESDSLNGTSRLATLEEAARRVRGIPGVERVSVAASLPLVGASNFTISIPERKFAKSTSATNWGVTPEMQTTMGLRLVRGRWITGADVIPGAVAPILISETGAKQLWPGIDPIGRCVRLSDKSTEPCHAVVGVIHDLRQRSLREKAAISMIVGVEKPDLGGFYRGYVVIRTSGNPSLTKVIAASRSVLLDLRPDLSSLEVQPIAKTLDSDYRPLRLGAVTFGSFALLTIILAAIGLYGILAFSVAQRTNEFGIRLALGAQARDLVASVVREGMMVVAAGVALGMALSWYASTAIAALLFQSSARDVLPYVYASVALGVVGFAASVVPAWRATRVDPAIALRAE